jgi:hypothetical protein
MDVIDFLCVWQDSSTGQLHNSLGSRRVCACSEAGFSGQSGYRALGVYYRRAALVMRFFWKKGSMQMILIKKCFLFSVGSICRGKAVHNWVDKSSQGRSKSQ